VLLARDVVTYATTKSRNKMINNKRLGVWLSAIGVICISGTFLFRTSAQTDMSKVPEWMRPSEDLPLVRLVVSPEKYHGKRVRVIGFVRLEEEGSGVYVHKEDYQHALIGNGVWINVSGARLDADGQKNRNMKYCLIEGTFDAKKRGHKGAWSGSIKNISRFEVWSDPAKPRR